MPDVSAINRYLQDRLRRENLSEVGAVQAAEWLHQAGLLKDSASRPGLPLRDLLRKGRVRGQHQEPNGRWYIRATDPDCQEPAAHGEPASSEMPVPRLGIENLHVLPDYLQAGLDIVFVGTAASDVSASRKHYYSGYNNAFYRSIFESGIVPVRLGPEDDWRLPDHGIGLTDMVKSRHAGNDANLCKAELSGGAPSLREKILAFKPRIVCFNGKTAYTAFAGAGRHRYGLTRTSIGTSQVFVVPSTSGRVNASAVLDGKTRLQWFEALAQVRDGNAIDEIVRWQLTVAMRAGSYEQRRHRR